METKIIDEQTNTGTKIIEPENTGGTVIIPEETKNTNGTQIIENTGTVIIENSENKSETNNSEAGQTNNSNNGSEIIRLNGVPLAKGTELLGYKIKDQMNTNSGEADLYLAEKDSVTYVFKYYRNSHKPKTLVVEKIKNLRNSHIIKLFEYGFYNERFFEIYEYAKAGNLNKCKKDGSLQYLPLKEDVVFNLCREIVEAFNEFHQAGIIHRDIKPDNFFLRDEKELDIVIGDFGIASVMDEGEELHKTKTQHHSVGYVPREFFTADYKGIGTGIDYYALGITLWELATGGKPFSDPNTGIPRNENHIIRDTFEGRLADDLLSRKPELSHKLQKLIRGLLVTDYEKRWGYSEVIRYLNGEDVEVIETKRQSFRATFLEKIYEDEKELASALWEHKTDVKFGDLSRIASALDNIHYYRSQDIQNILQDITDKNNLEVPLLKFVYILNPDISFPLGKDEEGNPEYYISSKDNIIEMLESAPEMIAPAFENTDSLLFVYISQVIGESFTSKFLETIKQETERNKKFYKMNDSLYLLKIISKAKLILKDEPIRPFNSDKYKLTSLYDIKDLEHLDEELQMIILKDVKENIYEGDIVPWLELKTGKRVEDFYSAACNGWTDFYKSVSTETLEG